jgi:MFS family permease
MDLSFSRRRVPESHRWRRGAPAAYHAPMPRLREFVHGPWRAVAVLGVTQILAWGTLFYPPVLTMPLIAADLGWSIAFCMSGLSIGLLSGGLAAPAVGRLIDRHGGAIVMTAGSLIGAAGLFALAHSTDRTVYLGVWVVLGVALSASLYDASFATLGRIFGAAARRPITLLTFAGGFASAVSWPATHVLLDAYGWRTTYLVYAGLLALVAAPLHWFALPRRRADRQPPARAGVPLAAVLPAGGLPFILVATGFAAYSFVPSGMSAHLLAIFGRAGIDAGTVVTIGALFGPSQVASRLFEFTFGGNTHPLAIARSAVALALCAFVLLALAGISAVPAALFAIMFGVSNGLMTIARGTVPLTMFGAAGYGRVVGRLAAPWLAMQSAAPLVLAFVVERISDAAALGLTACFAATALASFLVLRMPPAKARGG